LYSVDNSQDDHVALDDEGGAKVVNSKKRFIAPALAVLAPRASSDPQEEAEPAGCPELGAAGAYASGSLGTRGVGGFFGLGLVGVGLSQLSRPVATVLSVVGAAEGLDRNVIGKGHELSFAADAPIQVRLAPAKTPVR
jgi:hypothetical protein